MAMTGRWVLCGALIGWLLGVGAANATAIVTQNPCVSSSGYCLTFGSTAGNVTIRSFTFNLPSAKTVLVEFHGSLYCGHSGVVQDAVVDVATQIKTDTSPADPNGPGGLRQAVVLKDASNHIQNSSDTFNLTSTRTIAFPSGGNKTVRFMLKSLKIDGGISCYAYNATFSVVIP